MAVTSFKDGPKDKTLTSTVQEVSSSVPLKLKVKSSTYLLTGVVWVAVTTPDESVAKY